MPEEQHDLLANVPVVYTNNVRLQMTFADFKIYFGEVIPIGPASEMGAEIVPTQQKIVDRVCVVISPDLLPALLAGLTQAIQKYQEQFGPLRKPPQLPQPPQPPPAPPGQKA
jgi:hypothetical protein